MNLITIRKQKEFMYERIDVTPALTRCLIPSHMYIYHPSTSLYMVLLTIRTTAIAALTHMQSERCPRDMGTCADNY